jgi:hypothetical protein
LPATLASFALTAHLPTGTLTLTAADGVAIADWCDVAARANPKRGFLIVSKVLGRHLPARPAAMRATMATLAAMLPLDLPGPVVVLGMAETATALGQGCFAALQLHQPDWRVLYLQSSRQQVAAASMIAQFEEGHSHATTHLVQIADPALLQELARARTLIIVDDECSTGQTFVAAASALVAAMPLIERIETLCITDWSDRTYLAAMPRPAAAHAIIIGSMRWTAGATAAPAVLAAGSNRAGHAPLMGMLSRTGLTAPERPDYPPLSFDEGARVLVLGEGEHSYAALLVAEDIERQGGLAAVQCITRSPALPGASMASVSHFSDSYGSGAPCFLYNMLAHRPDRIVIVSEVAGIQSAEAEAALVQLDSTIPIDQVLCTYDRAGVAA